MANIKISELNELIPSQISTNDVLPIVDVSADETKKITLENLANAGSGLPIGAIMEFAGDTAPAGYLICDGSAISRTTYSGLFQTIGTTYGTGDGSTTFNIPNLKGKIPVGIDTNDTDFDTLGETGGTKTVTLTIDQIPSHSHELNSSYIPDGSNGRWGVSYISDASVKETTIPTGGDQPHNNLQPYIVLNYIIKY